MYHVIVNPASKSGRGIRIWEECQKILNRRQIPYEVFFSEKFGQIEEHVRRMTQDPDQFYDILVFGGDGTMNEVVSGVCHLDRVRIGYIPSGSSNDLARDMEMSVKPTVLMEKILKNEQGYLMDVGSLKFATVSEEHSCLYNKEHFSGVKRFNVSCGIGFDAAVCEEALHSKMKEFLNRFRMGKLVYLCIALKQLIKAKRVSCDLYIDENEPIPVKGLLFVACMNHKYECGGFMFGPDADYQDGFLDLCVVGNIPKPLILLALPTAMKGKHFGFPCIEKYRAREVRIKISESLWVHTDGEVYVKSDDIYIKNEPTKMRMIV